MVHVSAPIVWIAPIVDSAFFLLVSLITWLISRANRRIRGQQPAVALLVFLVVYDWLTVTGRPANLPMALLEFTVFGKPAPSQRK